MNNNKPVLLSSAAQPSGLDDKQQACVDLLGDALEEACKGRITSVAIVVCMDDGIGTNMAGSNGLALNIGCDKLKREILEAIFIDGNVARKKSSIINPRAR